MKLLKLLTILVLFALIFIAMQVPLVAADDLRITLESYEPKPAVPGNFFSATFRVDNIANKNLSDIDIELDVGNSLFVEGSDHLTINSLNSGDYEKFTFVIGVKSSANSGFENIDIDWDTPTDSGSESFSIQIRAIGTTLVIDSVESIPSEIAPGQEAVVKLKLKNVANILLKDVKIKLNLNSADLPFAPLGTVTERNIDTFLSGTTRELTFNIIALADASSGIYKVPLEVTYYDEFGEKYNITDLIALIIGGKPSLYLNLFESKLIEGKKGTVSIDIVNRGLTDAKFLNVQILYSDNFELLSSNTVYVGDVDSDDIENIEFELISRQSGFIELPLQLTYRDSNSKVYTESTNIPVKVYSREEAKAIGLTKTNYSLFVIIAVIIVAIIYFTVRGILRRKRNKF